MLYSFPNYLALFMQTQKILNTCYVRGHFYVTKFIKVNIEKVGNLLEVTTVIFARTAGSGIGIVH